ncbi:MAG TPA: helix-hairpin-helix domain-containing protein [Saprospiraceae bacterium]|nr:helix-hairpin-helix domain-containing protein [Saprospiraceae bacterium]
MVLFAFHKVPSWIYINRTERKGLFYLAAMIIISFAVLVGLEYIKDRTSIHSSEWLLYFDDMGKEFFSISEEEDFAYTPFYFNPNQISGDSLKMLGLSSQAIKSLENYRNKGGQIRRKEDFKRIYGVTDEDYDRLSPYMVFDHNRLVSAPNKMGTSSPQNIWKKDVDSDKPKKQEYASPADMNKMDTTEGQQKNSKEFIQTRSTGTERMIDLNSADPIVLQYIKGIGPVFAERMVKYREFLGGFHSIGQLLEVYGMDPDRFEQVKGHFIITKPYRTINLNASDYKQLIHPYISENEARVIFAYRQHHGDYHNVFDLLNIQIFDYDFIDKIMPYISDDMKTQ